MAVHPLPAPLSCDHTGPAAAWRALRGGEAKVRTKLSVCIRKARYPTEQDALLFAQRIGLPLRPYRCDRCRHVHLTSRTKGKRVPRPPA